MRNLLLQSFIAGGREKSRGCHETVCLRHSVHWKRTVCFKLKKIIQEDVPGGTVVRNPLSNAEDTSSIPGQRTKIPYT